MSRVRAALARLVRRFRSTVKARAWRYGLAPAGRRARKFAVARREFAALALRDTVLYESYYGTGALCNPEAVFAAAIADPRLQHLTHVWVVRGPDSAPHLRAAYGDDRRVRFVTYGSIDYLRELATARWLVNNSTWPPHWAKRQGQVAVNTWHGTPLKRMGFDSPEGPQAAANTLRGFLKSDFLLSQSPYMTERMYRDAYRLGGVFAGTVLEVGYPRTDLQHRLAADPATARAWLAHHGVEVPKGKRVVLVAPTWRGASFQRPVNDAREWADAVRALQHALGDEFHVLLKVHQQVAKHTHELGELRANLVPTDAPTNGVLAAADVLVTDYSSIVFDFASLRRPVVHYVPHAAEYEATRGIYLQPQDLPGPVVAHIREVAELVGRTARTDDGHIDAEWAARVAAFADEYTPRDDGGAAQRVVDAVFHGVTADGDTRRLSGNAPRLLVYPGGMLRNGITASALSLLGALDYEGIDVTVAHPRATSASIAEHVARIDARARTVEMVESDFETLGRTQPRGRGRVVPTDHVATLDEIGEVFGPEWARSFGDAEFDAIVDFSGYSPRLAATLAVGPARHHAIWLHNDLHADRERTVRGDRPHQANLEQVFALYHFYDRLVSVSPALRDINAANLGSFAPDAKFVAARNTINAPAITAAATQREAELERLATVHEATAATARKALDAAQWRTFIAVGRLSPEKNHARLIHALAALAPENPHTRVVIVGSGPLRAELGELASRLGVADRVLFVGHTPNPYVYMAAADCFVLSSDYEGQPMVILEALVLGLPIVTTRFGSVDSALPAGSGLIVDPTVPALADGLHAFLRGKVTARPFDAAAYTREVMREFYDAIGMQPQGVDRG